MSQRCPESNFSSSLTHNLSFIIFKTSFSLPLFAPPWSWIGGMFFFCIHGMADLECPISLFRQPRAGLIVACHHEQEISTHSLEATTCWFCFVFLVFGVFLFCSVLFCFTVLEIDRSQDLICSTSAALIFFLFVAPGNFHIEEWK